MNRFAIVTILLSLLVATTNAFVTVSPRPSQVKKNSPTSFSSPDQQPSNVPVSAATSCTQLHLTMLANAVVDFQEVVAPLSLMLSTTVLSYQMDKNPDFVTSFFTKSGETMEDQTTMMMETPEPVPVAVLEADSAEEEVVEPTMEVAEEVADTKKVLTSVPGKVVSVAKFIFVPWWSLIVPSAETRKQMRSRLAPASSS